MVIGHTALDAARRDYVTTFPMIMRASFSWYRADVAPRRLMLSGSLEAAGRAKWLAADLYSDGSGIFAVNAIDVVGLSRSESPGTRPLTCGYMTRRSSTASCLAFASSPGMPRTAREPVARR